MQAQSRPRLFEELDRCRKWIEPALAYSGGTHDWFDIVHGVMAGSLQLWPTENGALVTEILTYPRKRVVNVFLGGGDMQELTDMHETIIEWAREQGCTAARLSGRDGWRRAFRPHGWAPLYQTLEKEFD
jgi:hypothetical protein